MTVTMTLTQRYVDAVLRSVPAAKRSDLEPELRASIADAIAARVEAGEAEGSAEVAVLTGLGDPARLAASYADTPLHLIGPALFLDYLRTLRVLAAAVLPLTALVVGIVAIVRHESVGAVIGAMIGQTFSTAIYVGFFVTALFALLERLPEVPKPLTGAWTPSLLPSPGTDRVKPPSITDVVGSVTGLVTFSVLVLLAPSLSPTRDVYGHSLNILSSWLWHTGIIYVFVGLLLVTAALVAASHYRPRLVAAGTAVGIVTSLLVIGLAATDRVLSQDFAAANGWEPEVTHWINYGLIIAAGLAIITNVVELIRRQGRR